MQKFIKKNQTEKKQNSILLSTFSPNSRDLMEISLESTQIKLVLKIGNNDIVSGNVQVKQKKTLWKYIFLNFSHFFPSLC